MNENIQEPISESKSGYKYVGVREEVITSTGGLFSRLQHNNNADERATYEHVDSDLIKENVVDDNSGEYMEWITSLDIDPRPTFRSKLEFKGNTPEEKKLAADLRQRYQVFKKSFRSETHWEKSKRLERESKRIQRQLKSIFSKKFDGNFSLVDDKAIALLREKKKAEILEYKDKQAIREHRTLFQRQRRARMLGSLLTLDGFAWRRAFMADKKPSKWKLLGAALNLDFRGFLKQRKKIKQFEARENRKKEWERDFIERKDKEYERIESLIEQAQRVKNEVSKTQTREEFNYQRNKNAQEAFLKTLTKDELKRASRYDESTAKKLALEQLVYFSSGFEKENFPPEAKRLFVEKWGERMRAKNVGDQVVSYAWHLDEPEGTPHCHIILGLKHEGKLRKHNQKEKGYLKGLQDTSEAVLREVVQELGLQFKHSYRRGESKFNADGTVKDTYKKVKNERAQEWKARQHAKAKMGADDFLVAGDLLNLEHLSEYSQLDKEKKEAVKKEVGRIRAVLKDSTEIPPEQIKKLRSFLTTWTRSIWYIDQMDKIEKSYKKIDLKGLYADKAAIDALRKYGIQDLLNSCGNAFGRDKHNTASTQAARYSQQVEMQVESEEKRRDLLSNKAVNAGQKRGQSR